MLKITKESSAVDKAIVVIIGSLFFGITSILTIILLSRYIGDYWALALIFSHTYSIIFAVRMYKNLGD